MNKKVSPPLHRRVLASLALVCLLTIVGLTLTVVVMSPLLFLVMIISSFVSIFGVWLVFTGEGQRAWSGWACIALGASFLIVEIVLFSQRNQFWILPSVLALLSLYVWLVRRLRKAYWDQRRDQALATRRAQKLPQAVLIINPKSGNGRALKAGIDKRARAMGIKVIVTKKSDNIEELAETAAGKGAKILAVSGGDGTLGVVAKVALEHDLPLVVLPGGTRCHFARDLGLEPEHIVESLDCFYGIERRIDVGRVNGRVFLNNVSLGLYADIVDQAGYRENKLMTTQQVLRRHLNNTNQAYAMNFTDGWGNRRKEVIQLLVSVNRYETLTILEPGHRYHLDRGELQITALYTLSDRLVSDLTQTLTIRKYFSRELPVGLDQWTAQEFTVRSKAAKLVAGVDGEREEYVSPVRIEIMPKALRIMVPPEGMRKRPRSPFRWSSLRHLWRVAFDGRS